MRFLPRPFIVLLLVGMLGSSARADKQFLSGSLIIPPGAAYQSDCGAVSMYGLVYNILRANDYMAARPLLFPKGPIELYYTYSSTKASPNRCTPTNKSVDPLLPGDPRWLDGCDFSITPTPAATPVMQVNNLAPAAINDTFVTTVDHVGDSDVYPGYAAETINYGLYGQTTVRYLGAPFIIDSSDASTFLNILAGTTLVYDDAAGPPVGKLISFAPFRSGLGSCNFGTSTGGYVNIHRAKATFMAPVQKAFTASPPRVALLATTAPGVSTVDIAYGTVNIEKKSNGGATEAGSVVTIKTKSNHGLLIGSQVALTGVNVGGYNTGGAAVTVTSVPDTKTFTFTWGTTGLANGGNGQVLKAGIQKIGTNIIVNTVANHNMLAGQLVSIANVSVPAYNASWTITSVLPKQITINTGSVVPIPPSFSGGDVTRAGGLIPTKSVSDGILQKYLRNAGLTFATAGGCPPGGANVGDLVKCPLGGVRGEIYDTFDFSDFATLLDPAKYKMVWVPHWETKATAGAAPTAGEALAMGKISTFLDGQTGLMAECHSIQSLEGGPTQGIATTQFQTCKDTAGACSGFDPLGFVKNNAAPSGPTQNCSDPNLANGDACIYFSAPNEPLAQTADFKWTPVGGSVASFIDTPTTMYRPGSEPLISGVNSLNTGFVSVPATARSSGMVVTDFVSRMNKDNDPTKANIIYVGGHDVSGVVAGTKLILQTLLLLGEPPIVTSTSEVSRASPIVASIDGTMSIVQGTFESVTPAPIPSFVPNAAASIPASFQFPNIVGHMRAIPVVNVTTSADDFGVPTRQFDAATLIPASNDSCADFSSGCRTVFTNSSAGFSPTRTVIKTANRPTVGPLMAPDLAATEQDTLIQRTLAGYGTGPYVSKLGGVDRSTVAVIPTSLVAGTTRPTVVYFGATDGMIHAVCGSISGPLCTATGIEMWAFLPRTQLKRVRSNTTRIDGSPHVLDMFGDFTGTGTRTFKTILIFQSGSGDPATSGETPSVYALDVTDPANPSILWEYTTPAVRSAVELGVGLTVSMGKVNVGGAMKLAAFVETNNGGTGAAGAVVAAINIENGSDLWAAKFSNIYSSNASRGAGGLPPASGIPGGAVAVDRQGNGFLTDVVFGTLWGDLWQLDAGTGNNRFSGNPLFRFTTNLHPFGAVPAIYDSGGTLYALAIPGGYADTGATNPQWTTAAQKAVAVSLNTTTGNLNESSGSPGVPWTYDLTNGEKAYEQALIVGNELFFTTDTTDVNDVLYGTAAAQTGHVYKVAIGGGAGSATIVAIQGGASSLANNGTDLYSGTSDKIEQVSTSAASTAGTTTTSAANQATRRLWLQTL